VLGAFVVFAAVIFVGGYGLYRWLWAPVFRAGYRPRAPRPSHAPDHTFDPSTSQTFRCGVHVGGVHASGEVVQITIDETWVRVSGLVPDTWMPRTSVTAVELVHGRLGPAGLLFRSPGGDFDSVLVNSADCVPALRRFGWPVSGTA